ncbi:MAG: patatin-like phospholipase family protein [Chitinophagaceae bacterium]|nr:patatin-like phospholipase family protein [Chitinophagaceae bacterium]
MKLWKGTLRGIWFSLPIQLLLLHFRKNQVLLFFWVILFAVVNGSFLYKLGAHMLFLFPEYLGTVGFLSCLWVGFALGIFILSWNITTFILHSRQVQFLATTRQPFLKYCFNNALLPLFFLIFYLVKAVGFTAKQELLQAGSIVWLISGFLAGLLLCLFLGFTWFFGADRTIYRYASPTASLVIDTMKNRVSRYKPLYREGMLKVEWYLTPKFKLRKPRDTRHYTPEFIQRIFKQHHISAMLAILLAFTFLIISGYFIDNELFMIPAAASITIIFAILVAVVGAVSYFLGQWALPVVVLLYLGLNGLYQKNILDPRNKAYGLSYHKQQPRPGYNRSQLLTICHPDSVRADSLSFIATLNQWKQKQPADKPVMVITCLSGGGSRSATFGTEVMYKLDSMSKGSYFNQTTLLTGASGGILGAAWYRELKYRQLTGQLAATGFRQYMEQISTDILNPVFSSFAVRDLLAPPRRFVYGGTAYIKDRGYAFEQQLSKNTFGFLDKPLSHYAAAEANAMLPNLLLSATVTADGRQLLMATRPVRFLMQPASGLQMGPTPDADAICFQSFFAGRQPHNLRFLTALRMSATFPYVLPSVWLPTEPVVDVMDAGFRDNSGIETGLRFLYAFLPWIQQNCSRLVLVEIKDKPQGGWGKDKNEKNILDLVTRPALLTQNNLFRFQEYQQYRQLERMQQLMGNQLQRVVFEYKPKDEEHPASLSFHLTQREKRDIQSSLHHPANAAAFARMQQLLQ